MIGHTGEEMPARLTTTFGPQRHSPGHGAASARIAMDVACLRAELRRLRQIDMRRLPRIVEDWREKVTPPETSSLARNREAATHRISSWHGEAMVDACTLSKRDMLRELGINRVVTSSSCCKRFRAQRGCQAREVRSILCSGILVLPTEASCSCSLRTTGFIKATVALAALTVNPATPDTKSF